MKRLLLSLLLAGCTPDPASVVQSPLTPTREIKITMSFWGETTLRKVHVDSEHMTCYFWNHGLSCFKDEPDGGRL